MIIECQKCESKVDARSLAEYEEQREEGVYKTCLLVCPVCKEVLVGIQERFSTIDGRFEWDDAVRVWPEPDRHLDWRLPDLVMNSMKEAQICFKAKAYSACAVMCGKVLESICSEHKTSNKFLSGGIKELLEKEIIDKKIFKWGSELRKYRNIGAHATNKKISKEDAKDLLDFASAICDYVFILTSKFDAFMKRRNFTTQNNF